MNPGNGKIPRELARVANMMPRASLERKPPTTPTTRRWPPRRDPPVFGGASRCLAAVTAGRGGVESPMTCPAAPVCPNIPDRSVG